MLQINECMNGHWTRTLLEFTQLSRMWEFCAIAEDSTLALSRKTELSFKHVQLRSMSRRGGVKIFCKEIPSGNCLKRPWAKLMQLYLLPQGIKITSMRLPHDMVLLFLQNLWKHSKFRIRIFMFNKGRVQKPESRVSSVMGGGYPPFPLIFFR